LQVVDAAGRPLHRFGAAEKPGGKLLACLLLLAASGESQRIDE
jgi:hypothetical protein